MYTLLPHHLKTVKTWQLLTADCYKQDKMAYMALY